jgi:2-dehydro-3-deoxygluconokinase
VRYQDSFVFVPICGPLSGKNFATAVEHGAAHGALAMKTPDCTWMASLREVENLMKGARAGV